VLFSGLGRWTGEREVCSMCARFCAYFCIFFQSNERNYAVPVMSGKFFANVIRDG
jgi:hypothetical protein